MITVKNKFEENNLNLEFSGEKIEEKSITISTANDVNFKDIIDYLVELIPEEEKLEYSFEDFSEEDNIDKLNLIYETVIEVFDEFNSAINVEEVESEDTDENHVIEPD